MAIRNRAGRRCRSISRFGEFFRAGQEQVAGWGIEHDAVRQDNQWVSVFSTGVRRVARECGSQPLCKPWKMRRDRNFAANAVTVTCWKRYAITSLNPRRAFAVRPASACEIETSLFARDLQPWRSAALDSPQFRLLPEDVVARDRHHALPFGELDLEVHHVLLAEGHSRAGQVELPHSRKTFVVEFHGFLTAGHEALAPGFEGFGVVQPEYLDVANQKPGALDRGNDFRKRGDIAAREDVLCDPRIGGVRPLRAADRMQHHHAIIGEELRAAPEEG